MERLEGRKCRDVSLSVANLQDCPPFFIFYSFISSYEGSNGKIMWFFSFFLPLSTLPSISTERNNVLCLSTFLLLQLCILQLFHPSYPAKPKRTYSSSALEMTPKEIIRRRILIALYCFILLNCPFIIFIYNRIVNRITNT